MSQMRFAVLMMGPATLFLVVMVGYPIILLVTNSLFHVELLNASARAWIGLDNYIKVLGSARLADAALRTLRYTAFALLFELVFGFMAALLFSAIGAGSRWHRTAFALPLMVSPIVAGILWRFLLIDQVGIINYALAGLHLISDPSAISWLSDTNIVLYAVSFPDIWLTTSFVALVVFAGLQNIPRDLIEAAKIDGAGAVQRFFLVTLPLLRPVIAVVLIVRGVDAAKTFDLIWIQTEGGPNFQSEVLSMTIYQRMIRYGDVGQASATATLFLIAMIVLAVLAYRFIWGRTRNV
ncbi:MAG: sugar ABC transporter permease [Fimbriimonadaceae bacterium]|nr:sugar ABC transporter permease [Fimbriimonadaceae bacterium]